MTVLLFLGSDVMVLLWKGSRGDWHRLNSIVSRFSELLVLDFVTIA